MAANRTTALLDHVRRVALRAGDSDHVDSDLLEAFLTHRDEAAFEAIVRRHGPMVLAVCRRILRDCNDADDVFQATFLVLARKAASIRPRHMLGGWLHGVAYRTAMEARTLRYRRQSRLETLGEILAKPTSVPKVDGELLEALDEELQRLPSHYHAVIVLCDLEDKTQKEAARQLACPPGTVACRLVRGRALLARRLSRRGMTLSVGALVMALSAKSLSAAVPPVLLSSTVSAAVSFAAGNSAAGLVSTHAHALVQGVLKMMFVNKLKNAAVVIAVALIFSTASALSLAAWVSADDASTDLSTNIPQAASTPPSEQPADGAQRAKPKITVLTDETESGDKKDADKTGTVIGVLLERTPGKGVLVKADGEDSPRRYWRFGDRKDVNKAIDAIPIGSRVQLTWEVPAGANEGPHVAKIDLLKASQEKVTPARNEKTLEATLAWVKHLDNELTKPRYAKLTLEEMTKLETLQLGGHRKSDNRHLFVKAEEFHHLTALKGLKKLHLGENDGVTDAALVHVGKLSELRSLVLWDAPMTDEGLKHLVPLKDLTHLDLAFATKISDAGLPRIGQLTKLEFLNLAGTKVTDVSSLKGLSNLKELRLGKLKVAGVGELKQSLPKLVVVSK